MTKAVFAAFAADATNLKIMMLSRIWDSDDFKDRDQLFVEKAYARARAEVIEDLIACTFEGVFPQSQKGEQ